MAMRDSSGRSAASVLPPAVGARIRTSSPAWTGRMASSWVGRRSDHPRVLDALLGADARRERVAVVEDEAPQFGCQGALFLWVKFKIHGARSGECCGEPFPPSLRVSTRLSCSWRGD